MHKICHGSINNRVKEMFNLCSVGRKDTSKFIKQAPHRTKKDIDVLLFMILHYGMHYRIVLENMVKYILREF